MDHYIPSFNLTRQQDAAEAFLHLLSSLKEETSECYVPDYGSLAEISTFPECKISRPNRREGLNEQERWQQDFLGPFNGILGSSLTCKTCSSQLSVDFEFFLSLPLSPLLDGSETIVYHGCSVEHCLKQFTAAELIDNYRCNRCWHIAAIKYFFTAEGHESQIEKLNSCVEEDSCDCRNLFPQGVPWPNNISRTLKQLSIVRCPKILCIHLQRASVNEFGELVKLQGHISFPMLLDLFPYTQPVVGVRKESLGENVEIVRVNQLQSPITRFDHFNMQFSTQMLQHIYGRTGENINILSEQFVGDEVVDTNDSAGDKCTQASKPESGVHHSDGCSYPEFMDLPLQPIIGRTGENMNISSEPLVGDMVGDANDFVGDKSTRALKPESGVHHSEGCSYPELTGMPLQPICGWTGENINISSESLVGDEVGNTDHSAGDKFTQALKPESGMHHSEGCCSYPKFTGLPLQSDDKINNSCHLVPSKSYMYRLVSVVEHFGRVGSGHYTVYRRARKSDDSSSVEQLGRSHVGWFCISDSNVLSVSERDVLAADASLLFYEKIQELS
ncbi:Ubiquitin carboxyl-terminal hydrolases family 2 [Macleaya cordata]|uniref:ubiquitinyl hydrolase 1 n=1 Tax=Macleaya cordata TaxID=56857 RepID=A0A200QFF3_MACCD|nr:Ubiquitin carboxyl-terminal hydrolases family 2 [Macleaya cordata]